MDVGTEFSCSLTQNHNDLALTTKNGTNGRMETTDKGVKTHKYSKFQIQENSLNNC